MEKESDRVFEYYNHIEYSIQKLDRVIKSMVEFSRNYHLDVQSTELNFRDLVNEVLLELAYWPEARKITFKTTVAEQSILRTDTQRMKVALHNLISNSVKYADFTKPDSFIHIDFHRNGAGNTIIYPTTAWVFKRKNSHGYLRCTIAQQTGHRDQGLVCSSSRR